jgi:hypothetical protein
MGDLLETAGHIRRTLKKLEPDMTHKHTRKKESDMTQEQSEGPDPAKQQQWEQELQKREQQRRQAEEEFVKKTQEQQPPPPGHPPKNDLAYSHHRCPSCSRYRHGVNPHIDCAGYYRGYPLDSVVGYHANPDASPDPGGGPSHLRSDRGAGRFGLPLAASRSQNLGKEWRLPKTHPKG